MKNKLKVMITIMLFMLFCTNKIEVKADTLLKDINTGIFETVSDGTKADSKYSFSISLTDKTSVEFWGYDGKEFETNQWENGEYIYFILPEDYSLSGNIGCYIYNVGKYNGETINLKCTFDWEQVYYEDGREIYPVIGVNLASEADIIGFEFSTIAYGVNYEILDENMNPISINTSVSIGDIDNCQYFGFKLNTGNINKIQCRDDSIVYYEYLNDYHWFYANNVASLNGLESIARIEIEDTDSFYIWYGADGDLYSKSYFSGFRSSRSFDLTSRLENWLETFEAKDIKKLTVGMGWGYFNGLAFGPYELSKPVKNVTDNDESIVTSNTISKDEIFYYDIYQFVPSENTSYYYDKFTITDTISDSLLYVNSQIYDNIGNNVTDKFTVSIKDNVLTVVANDSTTSEFYNNTYQIRIYVKLNQEILISNKTSGLNWKYESGVYTITNNAVLSVERNSQTETKISDDSTTKYLRESNVIVKYVDKNTDKEIETQVELNGYVNESYTVTAKEIDDYVLYSQPNEVIGVMTENTTIIIFYYVKKSNVTVKYVDYYDQDTEIAIGESNTYLQGEKYTTEKKEIDGYVYYTDTNNTSGTVQDEDIEVIYVYKKLGTIIVKFVDTAGNEIADSIITENTVGEEYYLEAPQIDEYTIVSDSQIKATYIDGELIFVIEYEKIIENADTGDIHVFMLYFIAIISSIVIITYIKRGKKVKV